MRISGRALLTACTLTLAIGCLTACTPTHTAAQPSSKPTPTPTPIFTSDAEALAAATAVFKKFEAASDDDGHSGWLHPELVRPYVSDAGYEHEVSTAEKYRNQHAVGVGNTVINNTQLESRREKDGVATVRIYVCEDLSSVDVRDASGKSLVDPSRADFIAYTSELKGSSPTSLVIQSLDYWSGGGVCKR